MNIETDSNKQILLKYYYENNNAIDINKLDELCKKCLCYCNEAPYEILNDILNNIKNFMKKIDIKYRNNFLKDGN